ncbi:hypothetical protein BHE17_11935 [Planococcus maritimus]|uniref:hypothetical protein n=1 Tax=Planococcus maritimus TaxID=192421 RepID=UPI00084C4FE8|nr:hypothetical protein [Planococcus maritimus]OED33122.1 hypothetical protein BHE17_11935 [Planococcus maritimus]
MPGFLGKIGNLSNNALFYDNKKENLIVKKKYYENFYVESRSVNKFTDDKIFEENSAYFVLTEGVVFNKKELIKKYNKDCFFDTVVYMYENLGEVFYKEFRGSFSGIFFDKKSNKKIIYTNHLGDKQVYFGINKDELIFGSELNYLVEYYQKNNLKYNLNLDGSYFMLTFGFMLENQTIFKEFFRLTPGHYIVSDSNNEKHKVIKYFELDNTPNYQQTEDEIIESIDVLFKQAVQRAFEKDKEYNYKHLVALSGGLDSRMTTWVANEMGYGDRIVNYTFSQTNYLDETIPKEIASDLKHEWIFKSLDNGIFLKDIDETVKISYGNSLYYGLAHGKSSLDLINLDKFGLVHTGMLGDVIVGTFYSSLKELTEYIPSSGAYSKVFSHKIPSIKTTYKNEELYNFYNRGFNGANQGLLVAQESTETFSPFYDIDFLNYCLTIPVKYRYNQKIYKKWMLKKHPNSAKYMWEKLNAKITDPSIQILGKEISLNQIPSKGWSFISNKLGLNYSALESKKHMNPLNYWYKNNKDLRRFINSYFDENITNLDSYDKLKEDCIYMFQNGKDFEKYQVLTLLSVFKIYFGENIER